MGKIKTTYYSLQLYLLKFILHGVNKIYSCIIAIYFYLDR